jgi:nucleoside-diphosphate-sugar epimerase
MKFEVKKVFIAGGTGFLGYFSALEFLKRGVQVGTFALPNEINLDGWFPKEIEKLFGNLFTMTEDEIYNQMKDKGYDTFVYSLGPDDRVTPPAPSYDFFHDKLVVQCSKICRAAKRAGMKRCVVKNSYFAYFDRLWNGELSKNHPYIKCRTEQAAEIIKLGEKGVFDVMILELPYIFGNMPNREPLCKKVFLERFEKMPAVFFPKGGTNMIHVKGVAEAVVAAAYNGDHGERYPIGNVNMKYKDLINTMMTSIGSKKRYFGTPTWMCYLAGSYLNKKEAKEGKQGGLNFAKLMTQIQSKDLYFDASVSQKKLGYDELGYTGGGDVVEGIKETMRACYPDRYVQNDPIANLKEIK